LNTGFGCFFAEVPGSSGADPGSGGGASGLSESSDISSPEALALMGAGRGQSKRRNPLGYEGALERMRTPLRRGGASLHGVDLHGKGKGKKGSISSIFQTSVTALSFLAFGGYLLCLIMQAIRAKNGMPVMNGAALSRFVFIGRRPTAGRRRKRDSRDKDIEAERFKTKALKETARRRSTNRSVFNTLDTEHDNKHEADQMEFVRSEGDKITDVARELGSDEKQVFSIGPEEADFNQTEEEHQSDQATVETDDDFVPEDLDTVEKVSQTNVYRQDTAQIGLWPMANVDDMYSALLMIAEGYSQYHQKFHAG
jgi:hypothetical protein